MTRVEPIGTIIRTARGGMSQRDLSYHARTTQDAISAIENGTRDPGWSTIARIIEVLKIPATDLERAIEYEAALASIIAARGKPEGGYPLKDVQAAADMRKTLVRRQQR